MYTFRHFFLVDEVLVLRPRWNDYYFGLCWTTLPNKQGSHRSMRIYGQFPFSSANTAFPLLQ